MTIQTLPKLKPEGLVKLKKKPFPKPKNPKYINAIFVYNDHEYKLIDYKEKESFPESYELVLLLLDEPEERVITGWHTGDKTFTGYRYRDKMHVKAWRSSTGMY